MGSRQSNLTLTRHSQTNFVILSRLRTTISAARYGASLPHPVHRIDATREVLQLKDGVQSASRRIRIRAKLWAFRNASKQLPSSLHSIARSWLSPDFFDF